MLIPALPMKDVQNMLASMIMTFELFQTQPSHGKLFASLWTRETMPYVYSIDHPGRQEGKNRKQKERKSS